MSDFFYRQASVDLPTGGRIRNNAWVTITSDSGFSLPTNATSQTDTYNPNKTGRPAPILKDVKISLKGTAGSLRTLEASFTCFDKTSFEAAEEALLVLDGDKEITCKYGYVGPQTPSSGGEHKFRVYDYSFKITKENYFDCSFKAVGKGGTYEQQEINAQGEFPKLQFNTDYHGFNEQFTVGNLFDYIDYSIQKETGKLNSYTFNVPHGTSGNLPKYGANATWGVLVAPNGYDPVSKVETGRGTYYRINYISLGAVVGMLNEYVLSTMKPHPYKLKFNHPTIPKISHVQTMFNGLRIWSPDPFSMLFPYLKGLPANSYHKSETGKTDDFIAIDSFTNLSNMAMAGKSDTPAKILLGRDLLQAIQKSFSDEAKITTKNKTEVEDKVIGMPLNRFMKKIFATILENTGGAWDLYLDQDEDDPESIYIVNRRSPGSGNEVIPLVLDPVGGSNGIRELSLEAKVPKAVQAKAFGGAPGTTSDTEKFTDVLSGDDAEQAKEDKEKASQTINEQNRDARAALHEGEYQTGVITKARSAVKALVDALSTEEEAAAATPDSNDATAMPFPLVFSVTMDGIEGFKFGDTITSNYLPSRYTKNTTKGGGAKVVFTVTEYEHKISGNDWTTTVAAICRLR